MTDSQTSGPGATTDVPTRQELVEIIIMALHYREVGDWKSLSSFFTEDCELYVPGIRGLTPFAGTFRGRDDCINAMRNNFTMLEVVNTTPTSFLQEGEYMVVTWKSMMRNRGSGPLIEITGIARLRFRGRQMAYYSNYFDTAAMATLSDHSPKG